MKHNFLIFVIATLFYYELTILSYLRRQILNFNLIKRKEKKKIDNNILIKF